MKEVKNMQKLLIYNDYPCYPLWLYSEEGFVEFNGLIPELEDDKTIADLLQRIEDTYNSFFINTPKEFAFLGAPSKEVDQQFTDDLREAYRIINDKVGHKYHVRLEMYETFYLGNENYIPDRELIVIGWQGD